MKYNRIVSIGAHSLDAELMGGPLMIQQAKKGAKCTFVHVTCGRLERKDATEEEKEKYVQEILLENEEVAKAMNCECYAMKYISSNLPSEVEFIKTLERYLIEEKVDLVITHWRGTLHERHYYTYVTVTQAVKNLREKGIDIDLLYGENCEDLVGFIPTCYYEITEETFGKWFQGLSNYRLFNGHVNNVPYSEFYRTMAKVRAMEAGSNKMIKSYMHGSLITYDN